MLFLSSLAIPVITRYVADLLGFTHRLRTEKNPKGEFSENQIYQHITNCQTFLAYGVDETKMLSRRAAFKTSMQFLYDLAESGNVRAASGFSLSSLFSWASTDESPEGKMKRFGMKIAKSVLEQDNGAGRATATLLLIALDGAYNSVLAVRVFPLHFMKLISDTTLVFICPGTLPRWIKQVCRGKDRRRQDRFQHVRMAQDSDRRVER